MIVDRETQFGKGLDDTFMSFLLWARTDANDGDASDSARKINVSKRLTLVSIFLSPSSDLRRDYEPY